MTQKKYGCEDDSTKKKWWMPGLLCGSLMIFANAALVSGCSDEAATDAATTPANGETDADTTDETSEDETTADDSSESETEETTAENNDDSESDDTTTTDTTDSTETTTTTSNTPSNGRTISVADLTLLSIPANGGSVLGVTANGGGIKKATSSLAASYDLPLPDSGNLFSLIDGQHWHLSADGVRVLKDSYTADTMDAVTATAFSGSTGIDEQSTVLAAHPEVFVLREGTTDIAFFKSDGTLMEATLPAALGDAISAGPIKDGDGFWVMSTTQLAYYAPDTGQTNYEWSDAVAITLDLPDNEDVKSIYMTVSVTDGQASFGSAYYLLTSQAVYTRTLQNASAGGSAAEVGSN